MSNITQVCPEARPLTYRKLGNLLASLGRNDSTYDETECFKLVFLKLNTFWSREIAQFLLASPLVTHEIENIKSLPFSAEAKNIFGEDLRLTLHPVALNDTDRHFMRHDFDEAFWQYRTSLDKLLPLFQIAHQKLNNPSKTTVSHILFNILVPISDFFDLKCEPDRELPIAGSPLFSPANPTYGSIVPDYCIRDSRQNVACVVNIKPPSFFRKIPKGDDGIQKPLCHRNMAGIMKELQMCMMAACSKFGILCDGYNLILVSFLEDWVYYQKNYLQVLPSGETRISLQHDQSLTIPCLVLITNLHSTGPSFLGSLIYFLYRAKIVNNITQGSPLYKYLHLAVQPRTEPNIGFGSTEIADSTTVPISNSDANVRRGIMYKSLVQGIEDKCVDRSKYSVSFKVPARVLRDVLADESNDDEFVVMKIYEPKAFKSPSKMSYAQQSCDQFYHDEWETALLLRDTPNANNIYWMHPMVRIQYFPPCQKPITGYAIISKFFESEPIPQNLETYELAKRQLEIIHEAGGRYYRFGDVSMIFSAGKLYLYGVLRPWGYDDHQEKEQWLVDRSFSCLAGNFQEALI